MQTIFFIKIKQIYHQGIVFFAC